MPKKVDLADIERILGIGAVERLSEALKSRKYFDVTFSGTRVIEAENAEEALKAAQYRFPGLDIRVKRHAGEVNGAEVIRDPRDPGPTPVESEVKEPRIFALHYILSDPRRGERPRPVCEAESEDVTRDRTKVTCPMCKAAIS